MNIGQRFNYICNHTEIGNRKYIKKKKKKAANISQGKMKGAKAEQNHPKLRENPAFVCLLQSVLSSVGWEDTNLNSSQSDNSNI